MTTKERLRELVDALDDDAAERMLRYAQVEMSLRRPLTAEQRESVLRGLAQSEAGEFLTADEVFAEYELD